MYRQIKYLLVELKPTPKITKIVALNCTPVGIDSVVTVDKRLVVIDWLDNILIEFVGKFDKDGQELYTGDILELTDEAIEDLKKTCGLNEGATLSSGMYSLGWAQGGFNATHLKKQTGFFIFEEAIVMRVKKLGNQFLDQQIIVDYLKPHAEEKMEGTDGEINTLAK